MSAALAVLAAEIRTQEEWVSKERTRISTNPETDKIPGRATRGRGNATGPQYDGGMAKDTSVEPLYFEVGKRIQAARKQRGMSRAVLAEAVGIGGSMLGHMESGRSRIMLHQLLKIAKALKKNTNYFLNDIDG